jgi:PAS domain S-box-containing protein
MKKVIGQELASDFLRKKAKEISKQRSTIIKSNRAESDLTLINEELNIHQIELEIMNNELQEKSAEATELSTKYQELFHFAPIGYFTLSPDGEILEINQYGAKMLGKDPTNLINKRLALYISEETRLTYNYFIKRVYASKLKEECELILSLSENRSTNVRASGITSQNGERCLIIFADISESKRIEVELNNSLALTEATLNSVHNGILVVNQNGKVLKSNSKFGEMWHIPDDILASNDDNTLLKSVLGQLADPDEFLRTVAELYSSPDKSTCDHIHFKDGQIFERISNPMYNEGKSKGRVWSFLDITERVNAETDLQKALWKTENILVGTQAGTWEWNVVTGEITVNERWAQIIGYRLQELTPTNIETWRKNTHPDDLKRSNELIAQHFNGKLPYYDCECRMKHKDGHWVWIHDRGKLVSCTEDGLPHLMFGTHIEITQRKFVEEALKSSEIRANALLHAIPDLMFKLNNKGVYLEFKSAKEDLAISRSQLLA